MANVIGDIAGQYKTLLALIDKMPDDEIISIGDMVDRGPRSKEVIEYFMNNGRAILGNHEHMMIDAHSDTDYYQPGVWVMNGGDKTLNSYGMQVPENVISWCRGLSKSIELDDGVLVTHAFIRPNFFLKDVVYVGQHWSDPECDRSIIWNRAEPIRHPDYKMQLAGHNSQFGYHRWSDDEGEFAICLDASSQKVLTGIHTPTMEVYQQEYIDD